jgi:hypothetical protein
VNTTAAVWLGLTVACAECHNHKYDPIPQKEFFQLYAFFNNATERDLPRPTAEEAAVYEKQKADWEANQASLEAELRNLGSQTNTLAWTNLHTQLVKHREKSPKAPERKAAILQEERRGRETSHSCARRFPPPGRPGETGHVDGVASGSRPAASGPIGSTSRDGCSTRPPVDCPRQPSIACGDISTDALWLRALMTWHARRTPVASGVTDWLATEFPRLGWSQKRLLRLLVTSAVLPAIFLISGRSSRNGTLPISGWARQNRFRLPAENVRDAVLAVSGLLNPTVGGPSVRPPLPADIAALGYAELGEMEGEQWSRPLSARPLYILSAHGSLSDAGHLRRA